MNLRDIPPRDVGYLIFLVIWATLPLFVIREPLIGWKRAALAVWYLGASLALAFYLVTR